MVEESDEHAPVRRLIDSLCVSPERVAIIGVESFVHKADWDFTCATASTYRPRAT